MAPGTFVTARRRVPYFNSASNVRDIQRKKDTGK
ncbi:hypothetical protein ABIC90_003753 [Variovorax boronicumulans]